MGEVVASCLQLQRVVHMKKRTDSQKTSKGHRKWTQDTANYLSVLSLAGGLVFMTNPANAQTPFQTRCRQWEDGKATSSFPCTVQFSDDGYVGWIETPYDTYSRGAGWAVGVRNKECLRSTGGGYQIAICPITD